MCDKTLKEYQLETMGEKECYGETQEKEDREN